MSDPREYEGGEAIILNRSARPWTWGKVFFVDKVETWGVLCWTETERDGVTGPSYYRAFWTEIEGPAREVLARGT